MITLGSAGTEWENSDLLSHDRLNQKTNYIGSAEPPEMFAGMIWFDLDDNVLKMRNKDNNGWITVISGSLGIGYLTNLG